MPSRFANELLSILFSVIFEQRDESPRRLKKSVQDTLIIIKNDEN